MNDPESARRLAAATLQCALKDAKGRKGGDRVEALAWLASTRASLYLDLLEIPQSSLLTRSGWMEWAVEVLWGMGYSPDIDPDQENVIEEAFNYLQQLKESQHAETSPSV